MDNIYAVVSWIKKRQSGVSEADLAKQFEVLVDLDYVNFDEYSRQGGAQAAKKREADKIKA